MTKQKVPAFKFMARSAAFRIFSLASSGYFSIWAVEILDWEQ
jgi:hypothetical protein